MEPKTCVNAVNGAPPALIFPGQGSQYSGMGNDLLQFPSGRDFLSRADAVLGYSLSELMSSDGDALNRTVYTQPAVFTHSAVVLDRLNAAGFRLIAAAGHSLGEYTALYSAGVFTFEHALSVIQIRAKAMDEAQSAGSCGMAAVIGMPRDTLLDLIKSCACGDVLEAVNFNAPDQIVVSGHTSAINRLTESAKSHRRVRTVMLPVSSAFHTPLMDSAAGQIASALDAIEFSEPKFPVVSNVTGKPYPSAPEEMRKLLVEQMTRPVLWQDCVHSLLEAGAIRLLEVGPGKVLTGLAKRIDRNINAVSVSDISSFNAFLEARG
jgi:[acyl-carrier-protein] S-malonyltransferase